MLAGSVKPDRFAGVIPDAGGQRKISH